MERRSVVLCFVAPWAIGFASHALVAGFLVEEGLGKGGRQSHLVGMVVVIMGVAGSGKTTVGRLLAERLAWRFDDGDSFHPSANLAKMSAGQPLDDADRAPWLEAIRAHLEFCERDGVGAVVTCSALKQRYREVLLNGTREVRLIYLKGNPELLQERILGRQNHFMSSAMLGSQLAALEEPTDALVVDIGETPEVIVENIRRALKL